MQTKFSRCAALIALVSLPLLAQAHVHLEKSTPANGSVVAAAPESFTLVFSEPARLTALSIQKDGDPAARKIAPLPRVASDHFTIAAPRLAPGGYTLRFRALDPEDNHVSMGKLRFRYAAAAKVSPGRPADMRNIGTRPAPDTTR
jgi:methionine-rich copper-binding protein CopC